MVRRDLRNGEKDPDQCCGSEMIFPDPDPTFRLLSDANPVSDPNIPNINFSVADPGSGAFLTPGSGIGLFRISGP